MKSEKAGMTAVIKPRHEKRKGRKKERDTTDQSRQTDTYRSFGLSNGDVVA